MPGWHLPHLGEPGTPALELTPSPLNVDPVPTPTTTATRIDARRVIVARDGDAFALTTAKPYVIAWRRNGELKASASANAKAAEAGAKLVARNAGDTDVEVLVIR